MISHLPLFVAGVMLLSGVFGAGAEAQQTQGARKLDVPDGVASVSGLLFSLTGTGFTLHTGRRPHFVEADPDILALPLRSGRHVTVVGRIDRGFLEGRVLKAENLRLMTPEGAMYGRDRGGVDFLVPPPLYVARGDNPLGITGSVRSIDRRTQTFRLDICVTVLPVDVGGMAIDPLDDLGPIQIDIGDRVAAYGVLYEAGPFGGLRFEASLIDALPKLADDSARQLRCPNSNLDSAAPAPQTEPGRSQRVLE